MLGWIIWIVVILIIIVLIIKVVTRNKQGEIERKPFMRRVMDACCRRK